MSNGHTDAKGQPLNFSGEDLKNRHLERPEEPSDFRVLGSVATFEEPLSDLNSAAFGQPLSSVDETKIGQHALKGTIQAYQSGLRGRHFRSNRAKNPAETKTSTEAKNLAEAKNSTETNAPVDLLPTPEDLKPGQNPADLLPTPENPEAPENRQNLNQDPVLSSFSERPEAKSASKYLEPSASPEAVDLSKIMVQGEKYSPETDTVVENNIRSLDKGKITPADFYHNIRTLLEPLLWNSYGRKFNPKQKDSDHA